MDQISPPMRIALLVAVLFAAAWFTVLKPSEETAAEEPVAVATAAPRAAASATPQSGLGRAAAGAQGAAQTSDQANAQREAAAGAAGTAPTTGAATAPTTAPGTGAAAAPTTAPATGAAAAPTTAPPTGAAAAPTTAPTAVPTAEAGGSAAPAKAPSPAQAVAKMTGLPESVSGPLARKQVVVLLFWDKAGSEDRAVRKAVQGLQVPGKVAVHVAPVSKVARYAAITQGIDVARSPSVVVVDRNLKAQLLAGFVPRDSIRQAIADARRA